MSRIAALVLVAISLAACGVIDTLFDGLKHVTAVENDLAASTGMRPHVGFEWHNGRLTSVTVTFPRLYDAKSLDQLAAIVRRSVTSEFKQTPDDIVLGFSLRTAESGTAAQLPLPPEQTARQL